LRPAEAEYFFTLGEASPAEKMRSASCALVMPPSAWRISAGSVSAGVLTSSASM